MKHLKYEAPSTLTEASSLLRNTNAMLTAGGTDVVGILRDNLLPTYPEMLVSLKNIQGLNSIKEEEDGLHIGANATLSNIASSEIVKEKWAALADAAYSVASPNVRTMATIGGNICQDIRCWYYRYPHSIGGRIDCARKEGNLCSAMMGENRYHSIFGGAKVATTPCTDKCPAHTDISSYMELYREGDIASAARIIMEVNPMPAITSRVCAHFCMENCNRNHYDESLNIGAIERHIGDYILKNYKDFMQAPVVENGKTISIVGSGPAGLTAAYYLRRSGYAVTIYESRKEAGGCLMYAIPAYRLPKDIVRKFISILSKMGIEFKCGVHVGEDVTIDDLYKNSNSVMLDTGTWKRPLIGLKGEELTRFGLDFLVDINSYIRESLGDKVVVVGGGNVAMDVAITAKRMGVEDVKMICLEDRENMPANLEEIERALEENVEILNGWGPKQVIKKDHKIRSIDFKKCLSVIDETGRFNPTYDDQDILSLDAGVIIMAIGQRADLKFLDGAYTVESERGRIKATDTNATSVEGIYAAGDVTTGPATVIAAIAAGKATAIPMNDYCGGGVLEVVRQELARPKKEVLTFAEGCSTCNHAEKQILIDTNDRGMDVEDMLGFTTEQAYNEAKRCFNCGCLAVNPSDMANMLLAYDAKIVTTERKFSAVELLTKKTKITDVLHKGEIVTEIIIPTPSSETVAVYNKYRMRESIDFAILAIASAYEVKDNIITRARLVMGAVAPVPMRAFEAEKFLVGKELSEEIAVEASEIALQDAVALDKNSYKIDMARTMIKHSITDLI